MTARNDEVLKKCRAPNSHGLVKNKEVNTTCLWKWLQELCCRAGPILTPHASSPTETFLGEVHGSSQSLDNLSFLSSSIAIQEKSSYTLTAKKWLATLTAQMMCDALKGIIYLYECIEELFCLPSNQNGLSHPQQNKWVEEELEGSVKLLDLCGTMRDNLGAMKMHIQDLQSALRREGASAIEHKFQAYIWFTKKANKDVKKQMGDKCGYISQNKSDNDLFIVVRLLTEAREITIYLLQSVLSFLSKQMVKPKTSKWSLVSKALSKRKVACEEEQEDDDIFIFASFSCKDLNDEKVLRAQKQLQIFKLSIGGLGNGLECLFRQLIRSRVSLLNTLSL